MDIIELDARKRELKNTRNSRRLRQGGRIPAVLYGRQQPVIHLDVDAVELHDFLHGASRVVKIQQGDESAETAMIKEVQWDHLGERIYHVDFGRIDLNQPVEVKVAIELVGLPAGVVSGDGTMVHGLRTAKVLCLPMAIPEVVEVPVANLGIGQSVTVGDLNLPDGVEMAGDVSAESMVVIVAAKAAEEEVVEEVGADEVAVVGQSAEAAEPTAE